MTTPLLLFTVAGDRLALPVAEVREIVPLLPVERPPTAPRPLLGFIALRGETLPLIGLSLLFAPDAPEVALDVFQHILVPVGAGAGRPALLVDRVEDAVAVPRDAIRPLAPGASHNDAVAGEVALADGVAHLLSLDRLLDDAERRRLDALTRAATRRAAEWAES